MFLKTNLLTGIRFGMKPKNRKYYKYYNKNYKSRIFIIESARECCLEYHEDRVVVLIRVGLGPEKKD